MKRNFILFLMFPAFISAGCSHDLHITNLDEYFSPPSPVSKDIRLGITSGSDVHPQNSRYINAIVDSLHRTGSFQRVIYPYSPALHKEQVDVVVNITVNPRYSGTGSNFLVNWPGFLIWAPAIFGYGYSAEIETTANINRLKDNQSQTTTVVTKYRFRQAEIDRTWTEVGWLEVSLIPFIGGIVFTQYDPDVTDEFITKVSPQYGQYVAGKIVAAL